MRTWTVGTEEDGKRLREVLRGSMRISYSAMKTAKWNGRILLNGMEAHVDVRVRAGDRIEVRMPDAAPLYTPTPFDLSLQIPFEDEYLMVIDKPAGLASQSSARQPDNTLENAIYSYLGCPEGFIYRPVNRLDKGTSGLMVVAKDGHTQDLLQQALHTENFVREYLAMTEGVPEPREGVIDLPIAKEDAASVRREVRPDGKPAKTRYKVLESWKVPAADPMGENSASFRALVRLRLETGRTHQIRVHLAALGCPIVGDFLYGTELPDKFPHCFALHSAFLRLQHPITGKLIELESMPAWLKANHAPDHFRHTTV